MTDHVMKLRAKGDIILAFGEELAKLRNHPELAWQHVWHDADACIFNEHDEIKEIAFAIYNIAGELRLKSMLPPMGARPRELTGHWCDNSPCTVHWRPARWWQEQ